MVTSVVSLNRSTTVLTMPGTAIRSACGSTTWICSCTQCSPSEYAASSCPRGTPCSAPRTTSAMYAALNRISAIMARRSRSTLTPSGMNSGTRTADMNSTVSSGTPRHSSMNPILSVRTMPRRERRPSASRMPSGSEPTTVVNEMMKSSISPPQSFVSTKRSPAIPPTSNTPARTGKTVISNKVQSARRRAFSRSAGYAKATNSAAARPSRHR